MYTSIKQVFQATAGALSALAVASVLLSPVVKAEQACLTCTIDVLFQGVYSDETCKVVVNDATSSETIILPTLSIATLKDNGSEAGSRDFTISLKECPAERTIALVFKSNLYAADTATGNLLNNAGNSHSRNVQIRIRKENGAQAKIDDAGTAQDYLIPISGEEVKHTFTASYYAQGSNAVTPGLVKTAAGIDLIYK